LVTGTLTAEELSDLHDEIFDREVSAEYLESYTKAWRSLYDLIF
jgi:hypothetical protein